MRFSEKQTKFLFYIVSTTRTIRINKSFTSLKHHKNFNCHLQFPTEGEYKFTADSRFSDIKSTAAVL